MGTLASGPGIAAFTIGQQASCEPRLGELRAMLEASGFEILETIFPEGGATDAPDAAAVFIAFDAFPLAVHERAHAGFDNARTLDALQRCREVVRRTLPADQVLQTVRATSNSREAWELVRALAPGALPPIQKIAERRIADVASPYEVLRDLSRYGRRSKVELIRFRDGLAVKKTCRHQALRYLNREADFLEAMAPYRSEILPVIERGANYFITPFVENHPIRFTFFGRSAPKLLKLRQVRQVADLLRYLFSRGYDPVDFTPYNLLIDDSGRVKAIDFEFVHHTAAPVDPEHSACLAGIRDGFEGDWPALNMWSHQEPYRNYWYGSTGLSLHSFLYDPAWLQAIKRAINYPTYMTRKAAKRSRRRPAQQVSRTPSPQMRAESSTAAAPPAPPRQQDRKVAPSPHP
jgi:hypothetical protein